MTSKELQTRLAALLEERGLARVHPDSTALTARAALESLAGLPQYEQLWAGDLHGGVQLVAVASGERLPGVELARRAQLLVERASAMALRVKGNVQVLQLALYDRAVPRQESDFVLSKARVGSFVPFTRGKAGTWLFALAEPALLARKLRGWPPELAPDELRKLLA
jgi:hypothetical protein